VRFWFTPVDPIGLHAVRLLAGLLFLAWLLPLAGHRDSLFGLDGWFDRQAYAEVAALQESPFKPLGWSALYAYGSNPRALAAFYGVSVAVLILFTLGVAPRVTSILTWIVVASFTANPALDSDADILLVILAFYLMLGYVLLGQRGTGRPLLGRLLGPGPLAFLRRSTAPEPSLGANIALRLLQVHLAIVILTSGLHKLQFGEWWAGGVLWFPLHPPFETTLAQARALAPQREVYMGFLSAAAYAVLAWQIGFPLFAWRPGWRFVLVGGAVVGWLGTALVCRLPLVGPAVLIGCLTFVSPAGWRRLIGPLTRISGLKRLSPARLAAQSTSAASLIPMGQRS
jgi:hypothetical protein